MKTEGSKVLSRRPFREVLEQICGSKGCLWLLGIPGKPQGVQPSGEHSGR